MKKVRKDPCKVLLCLCGCFRSPLAAVQFRKRKILQIQLPVGSDGHFIQLHIRRGDHVIRQRPAELLLQLAVVNRMIRRKPRTEMLDAVDLLDLDGCPSDARLRCQYRIYLIQLDPETAKLDLVIPASEDLYKTFLRPAGIISRLVDPSSVVFDKFLCRHFRKIVVACRHTDTSDIQLSHHTRRKQIAVGIHDILDHVRKRTTRTDKGLPRQLLGVAGYGNLRRSVGVEHQPFHAIGFQSLHQLVRILLTAVDQHMAVLQRRLKFRRLHQCEQSGRRG